MSMPDFTLWTRYVEKTGKRPCIESEEHTEEQSVCTFHYVEWLEKQVAQWEQEKAELVTALRRVCEGGICETLVCQTCSMQPLLSKYQSPVAREK